MNKRLRLAINAPSRTTITETFIHAHFGFLPFEIYPLFRRRPPYRMPDGRIWPITASVVRNFGEVLGLPGITKLGRRWASERIAHWLTDNKVDVVLAEYGPLGVAMLDSCKVAKIPLVVMFHGYDAYHNDLLREYQESYRMLFECAAKIIVVSKAMEEQLIRIGCSRDKITCNPYGVDSTRFVGAAPGQAKPHFLAVGRLIEKKAPTVSIRAFAKVCAEMPEARLTIVGAGPLEHECRQLVYELGMKDKVILLGEQSPDVVRRLMTNMRAFIQHSVTAECGDSEGTPVAIIEAQMSGLPVVSTIHAGIPDVVVDGETGYLSEEFDVDAMAERMMKLAKEPDVAAAMGQFARTRAISEFRIERHIDRLTQTLCMAAKQDHQT